MLPHHKSYLVNTDTTVRQILATLNNLAPYSIAFVVDKDARLLGSVTDGDIRRGFIKGLGFDDVALKFVQPNPYKLTVYELTPSNFNELKNKLIKIVPLVDANDKVIDIIHLDKYKSLLPLDAVIMAGGEGIRLRPLTLTTPKPLLKIGDKPILEHVIDRLTNYGVFDLTILLKYLGGQIESHFGNGTNKNINIDYLWENESLGTLGGITLKQNFKHDHILLMNSDLLTDIDFEDMYEEFIKSNADMTVATVPYRINVPYGVVEFDGDSIISIKEKPTYTYYSNAGIYIIKRQCLSHVPIGQKFDATELIELLVSKKMKVSNYPILSYWLDIGKHEDLERARHDVIHLKF